LPTGTCRESAIGTYSCERLHNDQRTTLLPVATIATSAASCPRGSVNGIVDQSPAAGSYAAVASVVPWTKSPAIVATTTRSELHTAAAPTDGASIGAGGVEIQLLASGLDQLSPRPHKRAVGPFP
jgi:hypothetical protein